MDTRAQGIIFKGGTAVVTIGVRILPRKEVLDVQGRAIAETLKRRGHSIEECHYGKYIRLQVKAKSRKEALKRAKEITESVLCNSLVENYELEILENV